MRFDREISVFDIIIFDITSQTIKKKEKGGKSSPDLKKLFFQDQFHPAVLAFEFQWPLLGSDRLYALTLGTLYLNLFYRFLLILCLLRALWKRRLGL